MRPKVKELPTRVRIIGGYWRSRLIHLIEEPGLRPTTDRVRETLFNWLGQTLNQQSCLDLFAGSGALGLEACSRGASHVTIIESNKRVYSLLENNIESLKPLPMGCDLKTIRTDATTWLEKETVLNYDIVFIDPPFDNLGLLKKTLELLATKEFVSKDVKIYVESSTNIENETILSYLGNWVVNKQLLAGVVKATLLSKSVVSV